MSTEEKNPAAHLWLLFAMWRRPRLVSGCLIATLVMFVLRLACSPLDPVPGEIRFIPLFAIIPAAAILLGPSSVWAAAAASLLADLVVGTWTPVSWFRAAGDFAAAAHVFVLWDSSFIRRRPAIELSCNICQSCRCLVLALPAGLISAAWNGLGVELFGTRSFGFAAAVESAQILLFTLLLAPVLFRAAARDIAGHLGDWRPAAGQNGCLSHWRPVGTSVATIVATAALPCGLLYSLQHTGLFPWQMAGPGLATGGALLELLASLLALHLITILWPD